MVSQDIENVVSRTRDYYNGPADEIYSAVYGDNLHLAIPPQEGASHQEAMAHTNELMAQSVPLTRETTVLDLGSGYGSTARYLAGRFGCSVTCFNLSERENEVALKRAQEAGVGQLVDVKTGDFHSLPFDADSFDVVWSQEAFLHGADKAKIVSEAFRVVRRGGWFAFTDVLVKRQTPDEARARIYDRIKTSSMWDIDDYRGALEKTGFTIKDVRDWSQYVAPSYTAVCDKLKANRDAIAERAGVDTVEHTIDALTFWVESAKKGQIGWALFVAQKPA